MSRDAFPAECGDSYLESIVCGMEVGGSPQPEARLCLYSEKPGQVTVRLPQDEGRGGIRAFLNKCSMSLL